MLGDNYWDSDESLRVDGEKKSESGPEKKEGGEETNPSGLILTGLKEVPTGWDWASG